MEKTMFSELDQARDKRLEKASKARLNAEAAMEAMDKDGDGVISEEEFVEALAGLNDRDNDFKERCVHAVAFIESRQLASACAGGRTRFGELAPPGPTTARWAARPLPGPNSCAGSNIQL